MKIIPNSPNKTAVDTAMDLLSQQANQENVTRFNELIHDKKGPTKGLSNTHAGQPYDQTIFTEQKSMANHEIFAESNYSDNMTNERARSAVLPDTSTPFSFSHSKNMADSEQLDVFHKGVSVGGNHDKTNSTLETNPLSGNVPTAINQAVQSLFDSLPVTSQVTSQLLPTEKSAPVNTNNSRAFTLYVDSSALNRSSVVASESTHINQTFSFGINESSDDAIKQLGTLSKHLYSQFTLNVENQSVSQPLTKLSASIVAEQITWHDRPHEFSYPDTTQVTSIIAPVNELAGNQELSLRKSEISGHTTIKDSVLCHPLSELNYQELSRESTNLSPLKHLDEGLVSRRPFDDIAQHNITEAFNWDNNSVGISSRTVHTVQSQSKSEQVITVPSFIADFDYSNKTRLTSMPKPINELAGNQELGLRKDEFSDHIIIEDAIWFSNRFEANNMTNLSKQGHTLSEQLINAVPLRADFKAVSIIQDKSSAVPLSQFNGQAHVNTDMALSNTLLQADNTQLNKNEVSNLHSIHSLFSPVPPNNAKPASLSFEIAFNTDSASQLKPFTVLTHDVEINVGSSQFELLEEAVMEVVGSAQIKVEGQQMLSAEQLFRAQLKQVDQTNIVENFRTHLSNIDEALLHQKGSLSLSLESPYLQGGKLQINVEQGRLMVHFDLTNSHITQQLSHVLPELKQLLSERYPQYNTQLTFTESNESEQDDRQQRDEQPGEHA